MKIETMKTKAKAFAADPQLYAGICAAITHGEQKLAEKALKGGKRAQEECRLFLEECDLNAADVDMW